MSYARNVFFAVSALALTFGCGGGREESPKGGAAQRPSGKGACALLMQSEVDELFGAPIGAGKSESLEDGSELCSWPSNEDPAFLLQVAPASADLNAAVDLGEGYRIAEVPGLSGPAAMAVGTGEDDTVAVLAMNVSEKTLTLSPIGLGLKDGTDRFQRFKALVDLAAGRL